MNDAVSAIALAEYREPASKCHVSVVRPADQRQLWAAFLDGALTSYRKFGVQRVLENESIFDGTSTAWFFVARDPDGRVVGGVRVRGPYASADEAHALVEWDGRAGSDRLRAEIAERIPDGVIEMKTAWVCNDSPHRRELTNALARMPVHAMNVMGVRYVLATVAAHAVPRWQTGGAVISPNVSPVAYPDDRYQTVLMWWDSQAFADHAESQQLMYISDESAQIGESERMTAHLRHRPQEFIEQVTL